MQTMPMEEASSMDVKRVPNELLVEILNPPPPKPVDQRDEELNHLRKRSYEMLTKLAAVSELTVRQQKKIEELEGRLARLEPPSSPA